MSLRMSALLSTTTLMALAILPQQAQAQSRSENTAHHERGGSRGSSRPERSADIVVTAAGYEQNVTTAPATISVITVEEIKKRSFTDISDVLKDIPGVFVNGGGVEQSIMIRGLGSDYTLFLIDGKRMQDNQAFGLNGAQAGTPINSLPPLEAIERIEVIRGPASSLYGSDAIGGVVNIITKKVNNELAGSVTAEYVLSGPGNDVSEDGFQTSMSLNIPMIKDVLSLQLTGAIRLQDEAHFVGVDDSGAADPEFKRKNFNAKLSLRADRDNSFTLGGGHTFQSRSGTPGRSLAEDDTPSYSKTLRDNFFLTHDGDYGDILWSSHINYDSSTNPTRVNATTGNGIDFQTLVANTQATFTLGNHKLAVGGNYRRETLKDGATNGLNLEGIVSSTDIVTMKREQIAAFVENNWQPLENLSLVASGRFDHSKQFGSAFSPKLYAVYSVNEDLTIKGGMTSGYKVPNLRTAASDFGSVSRGGVIIGNASLKPERTTNYEIGATYGSRKSGFSSSLTAYKSNFKDKLLRVRVCEANVECFYNGVTYPGHGYGYTTQQNIDSAELWGVEWTVDWKPLDDLTYRHSYTYAASEQTSGVNEGRPMNNIPKHMFNATVEWKPTKKLTTWGQVNLRGASQGKNSIPTERSPEVIYPSYTFFDAGLSYRASRDLRFNLGMYNIANKKVAPAEGYAYVLDGRRFSASISANF